MIQNTPFDDMAKAHATTHPTIQDVLNDPSASYWLKDALQSSLSRDPIDAANDTELLARLLSQRSQDVLAQASTDQPNG